MALTQPTFTVQFAFGNNPFDSSYSWTTIPAGDVKSVNIKRGRQHELQRFNTGTCTLQIDNRSGNYDPNNSGGTYFGQLLWGVPMRLLATWSAVQYFVFQGYLESFPQQYSSIADSDVTMTCVDAFKLFNLRKLTSSAYSSTVVADGATTYYRLNETTGPIVADSSGHGHDGTQGGTINWLQAGALLTDTDTAADFGGDTSGGFVGMVTCPVASTPTGTGAMSVEFWWKNNGLIDQAGATSGTGVIQAMASPPTGGIFVQINDSTTAPDGAVTAEMDGGAGSATATGSTSIIDGEWHHIFITKATDTKTVRLYIDGVLDALNVSASAINIPSVSFSLGFATFPGDPSTLQSCGLFDEFAIYPTALSTTKILTHYNLGVGMFAQQASGTRINAVLDLIGWPSGLRSIDTGRSTLLAQETSLVNTSALQYMQTCETSENGSLFVSAAGDVNFYDRYHLQGSTPFVIMGDGAGEEPYEGGPDISYDDLDIYNDITAQRQGGVIQKAQDATSITTYGQRTRQLSGLLNLTDLEVLDRANFELTRYKNPQPRVKTVKIRPADDANTLFPVVLGLDLLSEVTIKRRPLKQSTFAQNGFIEGIEHAITPDNWITTWSIVPTAGVGEATNYLTLDDTTLGQLDSNLLGY
jgi:Concanavalin A-like lectin/glucanases superfamily